MKARLYNTLTRKCEELTPSRMDGVVRLYTCGPTVYNYLHVGNYRTYVFEDILKRALKFLGYQVRHVMNITDVGHLTSQADEGEDKMEVGAEREGKTAWDIAEFYTKTFLSDIKKLRLDFSPVEEPEREDDGRPVDILCKATDHIPEQWSMVERLTRGGFTYETSDGIYFNTSKFPSYGEMAGKAHMAGLQEGARIAANPEKRNAGDFALWKFSPTDKKRQMEWECGGRRGFPGWHIECSAMGQTYLGDTFDIHCGGVDHIPIHHTNEIAQAEAATGKKPFVRIWLHGEFLVQNKAKMAKSAGGFIKLADLEAKGFDPLDYRYFCFGAHYRKQLDFSWEGLEAAKTARRRLCGIARRLLEKPRSRELLIDSRDSSGKIIGSKIFKVGLESPGTKEWMARFRKDLSEDLNMPNALATVYAALGEIVVTTDKISFLQEVEKVLQLGLFDEPKDEKLPAELQQLFDDYVAARAAKDYAASDRLRRELADKGLRVKDSKDGSAWTQA